MPSRQTIPRQWLIIVAGQPLDLAAQVPRGTGLLLVGSFAAAELRRLRGLALRRGVAMLTEGRSTFQRVHNRRELMHALLARTPLILLSPIHATTSHPDWRPIPRMRAAALARLGQRRLIALGGMNAKRYPTVAPLGFIGWAGISAFRT